MSCTEDQAWLCPSLRPGSVVQAGGVWPDPGKTYTAGQLCFMHQRLHPAWMARDSLHGYGPHLHILTSIRAHTYCMPGTERCTSILLNLPAAL